MATQTQLAPTGPAKLSRYRSMRRTTAQDAAGSPSPAPVISEKVEPNGLLRSMSRYRKLRQPITASSGPVSPVQPIETVQNVTSLRDETSKPQEGSALGRLAASVDARLAALEVQRKELEKARLETRELLAFETARTTGARVERVAVGEQPGVEENKTLSVNLRKELHITEARQQQQTGAGPAGPSRYRHEHAEILQSQSTLGREQRHLFKKKPGSVMRSNNSVRPESDGEGEERHNGPQGAESSRARPTQLQRQISRDLQNSDLQCNQQNETYWRAQTTYPNQSDKARPLESLPVLDVRDRMPPIRSPEHRVAYHMSESPSQRKVGQLADMSKKQEIPSKDHLRPETSSSNSSNPKGFFSFLRRRRAESTPNQAATNDTVSSTPTDNTARADMQPNIRIAGPGIDAPISAVNAGERRVKLECNRSSIYLPVNPTTTPQDLIQAAATRLSEPINIKASVLLEDFSKVGVQRPLRKYEHVRSVMNSWDDDSQNTLVLVPSTTGGNDADLEAEAVPSEQPGETSCELYYSQKPGKWDKKLITLRSDGQVLMLKKDGGVDTINVCHLSDFDIYTPQPRQLSSKIRPPKKICFAIKSQQKSAVFMSLDNFVHFFATGDDNIAVKWYHAVQSWRSWYLVNVMGEGRTELAASNGAHQIPQSSHSHLTTSKPLLDFTPATTTLTPDIPLRRITSKRHPHPSQPLTSHAKTPPSSYPTKTPAQTPPATLGTAPDLDPAFAPTSLLGRSYSVRQAAAATPLASGASLLNSTGTGTATLVESAGVRRVRASMDAARLGTGTREGSGRAVDVRRGMSVRRVGGGAG